MRIVIQRVKSARLECEGKIISEIGVGYQVFVGVLRDDTEENVERVARRIATVRLFRDENGKLALNLAQVGGSVLLVSNFTLCDRKGSGGARPDFTLSAEKDKALELYNLLQKKLIEEYGIGTKMGVFGGHMQIYSQIDGPINLFQEY